MKEKPKVTSAEVVSALRKRYPDAAYAFLEQVADATGRNHSRWADVLAMSLWPSRGIELHGIEVKVSRTDWLKELANPAKADAFQVFCHRWYLAVSDKAIVQPGELPLSWGLLVLSGDGMRCEVEAPRIEPDSPSLNFLAGVLRSAARINDAQLADAKNKGWAEAKAAAEKSAEANRTYALEHHEKLKQSIAEFESVSGVQISGYNGGKIGAAVKTVLALKHNSYVLKRSREICTETAQAITEIESIFADAEVLA